MINFFAVFKSINIYFCLVYSSSLIFDAVSCDWIYSFLLHYKLTSGRDPRNMLPKNQLFVCPKTDFAKNVVQNVFLLTNFY